MSRRQGPARKLLDRRELRRHESANTLVFDQRRRRPRYFDGRFLDARDLTREQDYFLGRQATLGRALGAGVIEGLMVRQGRRSFSVRIEAGHGLTPGGELVVLGRQLEVDLADVAESEQLDAAFGLRRLPRTPSRQRIGLFILGLRAVEFTANPIGSYPRSLSGKRSIEDGDIIEGSAVTLIPFPQSAGEQRTGRRRAAAARQIFVEDARLGVPAGVLPLAIVALDRGGLLWVDPFLVFRELGSDRAALSLGIAARGVAAAYLMQYDLHVREVVEERRENDQSLRFAAAEHFLTLPPAGRLPAAAVSAADFTQIYFPPEVEVDLAPMPVDELGTLLEEALLLPPVELRREVDELGSTAVQILVPVRRTQLRRLAATLSTLRRDLKPVAPGQLARRLPLANLRGLKLARLTAPGATSSSDPEEAVWRQLLAGAEWLWYVRHRNVRFSAEVLGVEVPVITPDAGGGGGEGGGGAGGEGDAGGGGGGGVEDEGGGAGGEASELRERLAGLSLNSRFERVRSAATTPASRAMVALLGEPEIFDSDLMLRGAVAELGAVERADRNTVRGVERRFSADEVLRGRIVAEDMLPDLEEPPTRINNLAAVGRVPEFLTILARTEDEGVARRILTIAAQSGEESRERLRSTIDELMRELRG